MTVAASSSGSRSQGARLNSYKWSLQFLHSSPVLATVTFQGPGSLTTPFSCSSNPFHTVVISCPKPKKPLKPLNTVTVNPTGCTIPAGSGSRVGATGQRRIAPWISSSRAPPPPEVHPHCRQGRRSTPIHSAPRPPSRRATCQSSWVRRRTRVGSAFRLRCPQSTRHLSSQGAKGGRKGGCSVGGTEDLATCLPPLLPPM